MNRPTVVVLAVVFVIVGEGSMVSTSADTEECVYAGLSGNKHLYLAQNCRPTECFSTVPTEGLICKIGNYVDHMPGACNEVERTLTAKESNPLPPLDLICLPLLTNISLYDYRCPQIRQDHVEKALKLAFILPLCNEDFIKTSRGIKVDFNADKRSKANYFVTHSICRTFEYSGSNFSRQTNLSIPIEVEDKCMAIGLQDGYPDVLYYISFTEFPSGIQVNYTTVFKDVKQESIQLLAGAWLTGERAHIIFQPIRGIDSYIIEVESASKGWSFSKEVFSRSPYMTVTGIPKSSNTITAKVIPNDKEACERLKYLCSSITLTLMDKNNLNLPTDPLGSPEEFPENEETEWDWRNNIVIVVGTVVALSLLVTSGIIYIYCRASQPEGGPMFVPRTVLWIAEPNTSHCRDVETYLQKSGFDLTHALQSDTSPVELMRDHSIIILFLPSSLSVSKPYEKFIRILMETKPLWKKVRVISYAEKDEIHLLPSSILRRMFANYSYQLECLRHLDENVYKLPEEQNKLVQNLVGERRNTLGDIVRFMRNDMDPLVEISDRDETISLVSESLQSETSFSFVSEISDASEIRMNPSTGRRGPSSRLTFERPFQAVPEGDEGCGDCSASEQPPGGEASLNSLLSEIHHVDEEEDPEAEVPSEELQALIHDEDSSRHEAAAPFSHMSDGSLCLWVRNDSVSEMESGGVIQVHPQSRGMHETGRKQVVEENRDASERCAESDPRLQPLRDIHETSPKQVVEEDSHSCDSEEEAYSAVPLEEDTERKRYADTSVAEVSDQRQLPQESLSAKAKSDTPSLTGAVHTKQDWTSSDHDRIRSVSPPQNAFSDLALDLRRESNPVSMEEEGNGQDLNGSFHGDESSLKPLLGDPGQDSADATQRPGTSGMQSESRESDHDPQSDVNKLDQPSSWCGSPASARPADDHVKREESLTCKGSCSDDTYGDTGHVIGDTGEHPAEKESDELWDAANTGFVPRGPPSLPDHSDVRFPYAGGGDANGHLSAGSAFKNQHTDSSMPSDKGAHMQLTRLLLELEGIRGRHRGPEAPLETYANPHYAGERDEMGERYFMPGFENGQPGSLDAHLERSPTVNTPADVRRQPRVDAPESQAAFRRELGGGGQSSAASPQHPPPPTAFHNGLSPAVSSRQSSGSHPGHFPEAGLRGFEQADLGQLAARNSEHCPASGFEQVARGDHGQFPRASSQQSPTADIAQLPADNCRQFPGSAPEQVQAGRRVQRQLGNPAQRPPGNPGQWQDGNPALRQDGNPAQWQDGNPAPRQERSNHPGPAAVGRHGNRRQPVQHEWLPQDIRNDSGCYSWDE